MVLMHVMLEHEVHMYHFGVSSSWVLSHGSISFSKNYDEVALVGFPVDLLVGFSTNLLVFCLWYS